MNLLTVNDLQVGYRGVQVLWGISLDLKEKEILAVVGANAAGKTTLLKTISGALKPSRGKVIYGQENLVGLSPAQIVRKGISQVPQGRDVFPEMTVLENLEIGCAYIPQAWKQKKKTLQWVTGLFPRLGERLTQKAGTLSGGEQQMLSIARSLMAKPNLLLVDEPSLGLAPILVKTLFRVLEEINREGVTILLVEQNVNLSLKLAHRAYVMENGKVVHHGEGKALLADERVKKAYLGI